MLTGHYYTVYSTPNDPNVVNISVYLEPDALYRGPAAEGDLGSDGGGDAAVVIQRLLTARGHAAPRKISR